MFAKKSSASTFNKLFESSFYQKPQSVATTDGNGETDELKIQDLPLGLSGNTLRYLHDSCEMLHTRNGPKLLALHKNYLVCFKINPDQLFSDLQTIMQESADPALNSYTRDTTQQRGKSAPAQLEGYVEITGFLADTHTSLESRMSLAHQEDAILSPDRIVGKSTQNSLTGLSELSAPSIGMYSAADASESPFPRSHNRKRQHYIRLRKNFADRTGETIFFSSSQHFEEWRSKLAAVPVFFTDFEARYSIIDQQPRETSHMVWKVQLKSTNESYKARVIVLDTVLDTLKLQQTKSQLLQEFGVLKKVQNLDITPKMREICWSRNGFVVVEEALETTTFAEWFSNSWVREYSDNKDLAAVLTLMLDLTALIIAIHAAGVSHGAIDKDHILVKNIPPSFESATTPLIMSSKPTSRPVEHSIRVDMSVMVRQSSYLQNLLAGGKPVLNRIDSSTPTSTMLHKPLQNLKFLLTEFTQTHLESEILQQKDLGTGIKISAADETESSRLKLAQSLDVYLMGVLFLELIYGIDLAKSQSLQIGIHKEIIENFRQGVSEFISKQLPLYRIDPKLATLIGAMLDPNPDDRPTSEECFRRIYQNLQEQMKRDPQGMRIQIQKSTMLSRQTFEGLYSGISSVHLRKTSFMLDPSGILPSDLNSQGKNFSTLDDRSFSKPLIQAKGGLTKGSLASARAETGTSHSVSSKNSGLKNLLATANQVKSSEKASPGTLIRRLQLTCLPKTSGAVQLQSKSVDCLHSTKRVNKTVFPKVFLSGRDMFRIEQRLTRKVLEDTVLDIASSHVSSLQKESQALRPGNTSNRSLTLRGYATFAKEFRHSVQNSSFAQSLAETKRRGSHQLDLSPANGGKLLNDGSSLFSLADKQTGRFAQDTDRQLNQDIRKLQQRFKSPRSNSFLKSVQCSELAPGIKSVIADSQPGTNRPDSRCLLAATASQTKVSHGTTNIEIKASE